MQKGHSVEPEVDLANIFREAWKGRYTILSMMVFFVALAVVYLFARTSEFEATVVVEPASKKDIAALNVGLDEGGSADSLTAEDVYEIYVHNLQSQAVRLKFYREVYLPISAQAGQEQSVDSYKQFNKSLRIYLADQKVQDRYTVSIRAADPEVAVEWLARYLKIAEEATRDEAVEGVLAAARVKAENIQRQIETIRQSALQERKDKIVQLKDALSIARVLGIEQPSLKLTSPSIQSAFGASDELAYMRGSRALMAEIESLEERSSDDPYIGSLRRKQAEVAFYRSPLVSGSELRAYRQIGQIIKPEVPQGLRADAVLIAAVVASFFASAVLLAGRRLFKGALADKR